MMDSFFSDGSPICTLEEPERRPDSRATGAARGLIHQRDDAQRRVPLRVSTCLWWSWLQRFSRKENLKRRARIRLRLYNDLPAALPDDSVYGGQPESGSFRHFLGSEEWLEQMSLRIRAHPHSVVGHAQSHVGARLDRGQSGRASLTEVYVRQRDGQPASVWHCVPRVHHQVQKHLLYATSIS